MSAPPRPPSSPPTAVGPRQRESDSGAGRGGLALTGGKVFFLAAGLIQQIALKAILGLSGYGALSTALSVASIAYNPMVQAGIQGVSRETAKLPERVQGPALSSLLRVHVLFSAVLGGAFFLLAPWVAESIGAPHVTRGIQVLSLVLVAYGLYAPLVGALNGARRFVAQASLDAGAATLRTAGLLLGAACALKLPSWLTYAGNAGVSLGVLDADSTAFVTSVQVAGTTWGFAGASVLILLMALRVARPRTAQSQLSSAAESAPSLHAAQARLPTFGRYSRFVAALWAGQILLNVLFQADALLLRRFAATAAEASFLPASDADPFVGAYRACQLFCFLPFQLLSSLTFVLFPLLAAAHGRGRNVEVAALIERGLRIALVVVGLLVSVLLALPSGLLSLVFGSETGALGAAAMRILAVGMGAFALLGVTTAALNSLGKEHWSLRIFGGAVVAVVVSCALFTRGVGLNALLLERTAWGTSLAMLSATAAATFFLQRIAHFRFPGLTLLRSSGAMAGAALLTHFVVPTGAWATLLGAALCASIYAVLLVLLRELGAEEWSQLRRLFRRR